jgi:hypothetical protein
MFQAMPEFARLRDVLKRKPVVGWTLYDWANSAFATTVMAGFFPVFYSAPERDGIISLSFLFLVGAYLLSRVRVDEGVRAARRIAARIIPVEKAFCISIE